MYPKAHFTSLAIAPTLAAALHPAPPSTDPEAPSLQPYDRYPETIGDPQPYPGALSAITVAAFTADGSPLPSGVLGYFCRVSSAGSLTRVKAFTAADPVFSVRSPMRFVIDKVETESEVGFDIDGYFAVPQSST